MNTNIKVKYNRDYKLASIGPSPWAKLGPDKWFNDYKIVCVNPRDYRSKSLIKLPVAKDQENRYWKTNEIIALQSFMDLANGELSDYNFLVYKPVPLPELFNKSRIIANPHEYAKFENKRVFRETFEELINLIPYEVINISDIEAKNLSELHNELKSSMNGPYVLQDELSGGGRGTYFISEADQLETSVSELVNNRQGEFVVVSKYIESYERSIQVFISEKKIVKGPIQQQLVRNPDLQNTDRHEIMQFCGGRLINEEDEKIVNSIYQQADTVAKVLQKSGFKGLCGIDFLVDEDKNVYSIELNARVTGMLPLLNEQVVDLPLYLLHILELSNLEYELLTDAINIRSGGPNSFVTLFNKKQNPRYFRELSTGNYKYDENSGEFKKINSDARWTEDSDLLFHMFTSVDLPAKSNFKLCTIFSREEMFDDFGALNKQTKEMLKNVEDFLV